MSTKTRTKSLIWSVATLAALAAQPAGAAPQGTAQPAPEAVERVVERRIELGGARSAIGISVRDVEDPAAETGAVVMDVRADGPADAAGIEPGDVIVEFDGERVRGARQLARVVQETPAGRTVPLHVRRGGSALALQVTPEETPGWAARLSGLDTDRLRREAEELGERLAETDVTVLRRLPDMLRAGRWDRGRVRLGIRAESVRGQLADYFGVDAGVLVTHVDADTTGAAAGLRAGDVITAIEGDAASDLRALRRRLARLEPGAGFDLTVVRDRTEITLTAAPDPDAERPRPPRRGSSI